MQMPRKVLLKKYVRDIRNLIISTPSTISPDDTVDTLLAKIIDDPRSRHVFVVDENNVLVGSVRLNSIIGFLFPDSFLKGKSSKLFGGYSSFSEYFLIVNAEKVSDIMNKEPCFVYEDTTLGEMAKIMRNEQINELPVVDSEKHVIGKANMLEIISHYLKIKNEQV